MGGGDRRGETLSQRPSAQVVSRLLDCIEQTWMRVDMDQRIGDAARPGGRRQSG
jgi:hypothetical protein